MMTGLSPLIWHGEANAVQSARAQPEENNDVRARTLTTVLNSSNDSIALTIVDKRKKGERVDGGGKEGRKVKGLDKEGRQG